jgi:hypothetical protein
MWPRVLFAQSESAMHSGVKHVDEFEQNFPDGQSDDTRHCPHWWNRGPQNGVAPEQSVFVTQATH